MPNAKRAAGAKKSSKTQQIKEHWKDEPEDHDFPAAADYLSLVLEPARVTSLVKALKAARLVHYKAKDLLRASALPLLPPDNPHVTTDLKKVRQMAKLSPVLLVRGSADEQRALIVADGYHRICASWHLDENADIPCRVADLPAPSSRPATAIRRTAARPAGTPAKQA